MSPIPVSKTKIIPPRRRKELLTRTRLLDMLFESLDEKLTLVTAPAGYGKTSLLIDLVDKSGLPACWLSLDELDSEPQRFIAYFIAALAQRFPGFGKQSMNLLENMNSFDKEMERLTVTLVNELYDQVKEHFVFILDDFHLLEGAQPIYDFVNRFAQLMDENCHLVISSRRVTHLSGIPLFVAREQVKGLDYADLKFQREELQALLAQNNGLQISDKEADDLIEKSEGWITGLQFSNSNLLRRNAKLTAVANGADLFEYLGQQVLDQQPPDLQEFVLRTSLLDEFDASLCQRVLEPFYPEPQDWQGWIKSITNGSLFALPVGEEEHWLRYHHLFRDFIRERFTRECPDEVSPILIRLQAAYEEMGEWVKAHQICLKLKDNNALADLIERAGTSMMQSAHLTLESWLNELPPSLLRGRPGLLSIRGAIAQLKGDSHEGLRLLHEAETGHRQSGDAHGLILTMLRMATVYRFLGKYTESLQCAEEVIRNTEAQDDLQDYHASALRLKGLILHRVGDADQAAACLDRSLNIYTQLNISSQIPVLLMEAGMAYRALGDFAEAQNSYDKALHIWQEENNQYWLTVLLNNMGGLYQAKADYEKAALTFEEGLIYARNSHQPRYDCLISISLGDLYAELEDVEMAQKNYSYAESVNQNVGERFLFHLILFSKTNMALLQKDAELARSLLEQAGASILAEGSDYEKSQLHLHHGRLHLLEGNPLKAVKELTDAETGFLNDHRELELSITRVWLAAAHFQAGNPGNASQLLTSVSSKGKTHQAALAAVHQAQTWLVGLQGSSTVGRPVLDLFAQSDRFAKKLPGLYRQLRRQAKVVESPVSRLNIQGFGQSAVIVNGKPLTGSNWRTRSVRELFFCMLTLPKPLTREQIIDILWQDAVDPARLRLRFKNDLYRLRRAVGPDAVTFDDNKYSFNRKLDFEYDVEAFDAFLARARSADDPIVQIEFLQRAVDLVQGPYLSDLYGDWTIHNRERLRQDYLDALVTLAGLYFTQAKLDEAISISQRAIDFDLGCEPAYQTSMQAYARLNDRVNVKRMYQACVDAMKSQFNLPPSKETEELYQRLIK